MVVLVIFMIRAVRLYASITIHGLSRDHNTKMAFYP